MQCMAGLYRLENKGRECLNVLIRNRDLDAPTDNPYDLYVCKIFYTTFAPFVREYFGQDLLELEFESSPVDTLLDAVLPRVEALAPTLALAQPT